MQITSESAAAMCNYLAQFMTSQDLRDVSNYFRELSGHKDMEGPELPTKKETPGEVVK